MDPMNSMNSTEKTELGLCEEDLGPLLVFASEKGNFLSVKYLVSLGTDVNFDNSRAIYWACRFGYLETVKFLVSSGSNITAGAFVTACGHGQLDVVKYLTSVTKKRSGYKQGLSLASWNRETEVVKYLISIGVSTSNLAPTDKKYLKTYYAYRKWRKIYLRNWVRKVLAPLYYSPGFPGGIQAKKELEDCIN
jgi:hypothetical protein